MFFGYEYEGFYGLNIYQLFLFIILRIVFIIYLFIYYLEDILMEMKGKKKGKSNSIYGIRKQKKLWFSGINEISKRERGGMGRIMGEKN